MEHYREIKPVLNKLSKYNVFDNLDVISNYVRSIISGQERSTIKDVENPEYNAIELYFADFLIINSILYCTELPGELSLRKQNDRYKIFKPVAELNYKVHKMQSEKEAHLQSSVFKLSKDLIDSIHEEGIVAYTS